MTNEKMACLLTSFDPVMYEMHKDEAEAIDEQDKELYEIALDMAQLKDRQNIADLGGWQTEEPSIDCFCLVETDDFPKNCRYVVAEWDNDAKCFYSESSDSPISYTRYKIIEPNNFLMNR